MLKSNKVKSIIVFLLLMSLTACSEHSKDYTNGYDEGYHTGYRSGYDEGYCDGQLNIDYDELDKSLIIEYLQDEKYMIIPPDYNSEDKIKDYLADYGYSFD